jgi:hypothetical protein
VGFLIAVPEMVTDAATNLASLGPSITVANAAAAAPTTGVLAAGETRSPPSLRFPVRRSPTTCKYRSLPRAGLQAVFHLRPARISIPAAYTETYRKTYSRHPFLVFSPVNPCHRVHKFKSKSPPPPVPASSCSTHRRSAPMACMPRTLRRATLILETTPFRRCPSTSRTVPAGPAYDYNMPAIGANTGTYFLINEPS